MNSFKEYIDTFVKHEEAIEINGKVLPQTSITMRDPLHEEFWFDPTHPWNDYCFDVEKPGINDVYPNGCIGIRVDDDFWVVAVFPLGFLGMSIQEMVQVLWPDKAATAVYHLPSENYDI